MLEVSEHLRHKLEYKEEMLEENGKNNCISCDILVEVDVCGAEDDGSGDHGAANELGRMAKVSEGA